MRKRVGINDFENKSDFDNPKVLDLGCGIGRHVRFCDDIQIEAYGIDFQKSPSKRRSVCAKLKDEGTSQKDFTSVQSQKHHGKMVLLT